MALDKQMGSVRLRLREAVAQDCEAVWKLRNEESARYYFFDEQNIPFVKHQSWWAGFIARADTWLLIVEAGREAAAGYVRFEMSTDSAEISICLSPEYRSEGIGTRMITESCLLLSSRFPSVRQVTARIREVNKASIAAFKKAGFHLSNSDKANNLDALTYVLNLPRP